MKPRRTVDQWRAAVYRSSVSDAVRVYLLRLADHMKADLTVCVPRSQIARELNRHEQRVAERHTAAIRAGLLDTVSPGYKGHTATYAALFPEVWRAAKRTDLQYAKDAPDRYALAPDCVPDGEYTSSYQAPSGSAHGRVPNERRSEERTPRESGAEVRFEVDALEDTAVTLRRDRRSA